MKRHLLILLFLPPGLFAQTKSLKPEVCPMDDPKRIEIASSMQDHPVFIDPVVMPQFPGGDQAILQYIKKNTKWPASRNCMEGCVEETVYISFEIDTLGNVSNVKVVRGTWKEFNAVALELVLNMPQWKPGRIDGKPVAVKLTVPVRFRLD